MLPANPQFRIPGYQAPAPEPGIDLWLNTNERSDPNPLDRYGDPGVLEALLAERLGIDAGCVVLTAGADDAIERIARAYLDPGRVVVTGTPTFEMIERNALLARAELRSVPWGDVTFPIRAAIEAMGTDVGMFAVVAPNNPTGQIITPSDLAALAEARSDCLILLDLAYIEFAGDIGRNLIATALRLPNVVSVRTFSKAYGLAGWRVGYAYGAADAIAPLRAMGRPFAVATASIERATRTLMDIDLDAYVAVVADERARLCEQFRQANVRAYDSYGNFVFIDAPDAALWAKKCATSGIAIRTWPEQPTYARITCPGDPVRFARLTGALAEVL